MTRDGGLPDALAGSGDSDRWKRERKPCRRLESEVGADVRHAEREHPACESKPLDRPEDGLVGEVDDDLEHVRVECGLDIGGERDTVVLPSSQLLLAADEHGGDELVRKLGERVTDDRGVVLAVDDGQRSQVRAVTSSSIAPVNFAYSSVSSENETSRTWPWNGWRRQISTRFSSISMTL
jgi:hypothetical protein